MLLVLLILWSAVQLGAGLYEKQVVIPLWAAGATPATMGDRLAASGHTDAASRFWPFVSPVVFLLAVANLAAAWRRRGPARPWWLAASTAFIAMSIATYAYFVPTMLSLMHDAESYTAGQLSRTMDRWLSLSWLRSLVALPAWFAAVKALTLASGRPG